MNQTIMDFFIDYNLNLLNIGTYLDELGGALPFE